MISLLKLVSKWGEHHVRINHFSPSLSVSHDPWLEPRRKGTIVQSECWRTLALLASHPAWFTSSHLENSFLPMAPGIFGVVANGEGNTCAVVVFLWLLEQSCILQLCSSIRQAGEAPVAGPWNRVKSLNPLLNLSSRWGSGLKGHI